jgi:hypothetical protein
MFINKGWTVELLPHNRYSKKARGMLDGCVVGWSTIDDGPSYRTSRSLVS